MMFTLLPTSRFIFVFVVRGEKVKKGGKDSFLVL